MASAAGSLAFTIVFYEDAWSFRYAAPLLWWAVITVAAWLAPLVRRHVRTAGIGVAFTIAAASAIVLAPGLHVPRLLDWKTSLSACLRQEGLHTGLADYWIARRTSMSADWALQIQPLDSYGAARVWGNDWAWFTHDLHDSSRRPDYQFIVLDRLPAARIEAVYGQPDRVVHCDNKTIWVFNDPDRLFSGLRAASPFMAEVFGAAPPRP